MITEHDLLEAIAECKGERNPNANTCIKLAAFLTIQRELFGGSDPASNAAPVQALVGPPDRGYPYDGYSYDPPPPVSEPEPTITYDSGTDFSRAIRGRYAADVWPIIDELLTVLQATMPAFFDGVIRKIEKL